jgi:hypothetical protein
MQGNMENTTLEKMKQSSNPNVRRLAQEVKKRMEELKKMKTNQNKGE